MNVLGAGVFAPPGLVSWARELLATLWLCQYHGVIIHVSRDPFLPPVIEESHVHRDATHKTVILVLILAGALGAFGLLWVFLAVERASRARGYLEKALEAYDRRDIPTALELAERAAQVDPSCARCKYWRGNIRIVHGLVESGLEDVMAFESDADEWPGPQRLQYWSFRTEGHAQLDGLENYRAAVRSADRVLALDEHEADEETRRYNHDLTALCYNNLAWALGVQPHAAKGSAGDEDPIALARKACRLTNWKEPGILDTLAMLYAVSGDFDNAVIYGRQAIEAATDGDRERFRRRLTAYEAGEVPTLD